MLLVFLLLLILAVAGVPDVDVVLDVARQGRVKTSEYKIHWPR